MNVAYHYPAASTIYAQRTIHNGFKRAFEDLGHDFYTFSPGEQLPDFLERTRPDIFITASHFFYRKQLDYQLLKRWREQGMKLFTKIDFWNSPLARINEAKSMSDDHEALRLMRDGLLGDVFYHVVEQGDPRMDGFEASTGQHYVTIPLAADKTLERPNDEHAVKPALLSLTEATELGTVYSLDELRELGELAHAHGLRVHVDGARFANAAAALGASLPELVDSCGVDLLSFGGTKNSLMFGEAVVVFDQGLVPGMLHLRKQTLQLASKMRYVAAQFDALLEDELWLENATHANAMARRLWEAVADVEGVVVTRAPVVNSVFAILPSEVRVRLQQEFDFYEWDDASGEVRWMCSWDTTEDDVAEFARAVRAAFASA